MAGFEDAWSAVAGSRDGQPVSCELKPLLQDVYADVLEDPPNLAALKTSLTSLLEYLRGPGRTNANCRAVDMFFCLSQDWDRDWAEQDLPEDFHDVLSMKGNSLHDAVKNPEIADNFDCLPEQLLKRVERLRG
jgi:hypothetical protein